MFISSWIGGFRAGLGATALSTLIVLWFFVPPTHALLRGEPRAWFPTVVFVAMGVLFSIFHERLRRSERRSRDSEAQARSMLESVRQGATVFEATNEAITVTDTAARIVAVNAAFSTITGFAAGEALGATPRIHRSGRQDRTSTSACGTACRPRGSGRARSGTGARTARPTRRGRTSARCATPTAR